MILHFRLDLVVTIHTSYTVAIPYKMYNFDNKLSNNKILINPIQIRS